MAEVLVGTTGDAGSCIALLGSGEGDVMEGGGGGTGGGGIPPVVGTAGGVGIWAEGLPCVGSGEATGEGPGGVPP